MVLGQNGVGGCRPALLTTPRNNDQATDEAYALKALGGPVRLRPLLMAASRAGAAVCRYDLTPAFDPPSQPTIAHHLTPLKQAGPIDDSKQRGTWAYYRLLPQTTDRLAAILTWPTGQPLTKTTPVGVPS